MTKLEMTNLSRGLSNLYTGLETNLISNIANYLKSGDLSSSTAQWKIQMLAQLGALDKTNIKTIAEYSGIAPGMLTEALEAAALTAIGELEPGFQKLVKDGIINNTEVPIEKTMSKALTSYHKQARQSLNMVNTVMRFKAKSAAQKIINDTAELAEKQSFVDMLNKSAGKAVIGAESRQAAMRQCIKEMSEKGIPAFVDKLGREWSPEAYINMDIRTTVSNTANQAQFDRMEAYGLNLVEVSSHSGARPKCAKDQGKIFNRSGGGGYTTDLHGRKIRYYAWSDSSYGEPDGLLGINCGHKIYPFIPGVSFQTYFPTDEKENNEQYIKVQGQRELERRVRKSRRECTALETVGDTEGLKKAAVVLKQRQQALKQYCSDNGLNYKADRTAVVGYNRTVAGKVNSVNRKTASESNQRKIIDKSVSNGIIKAKRFERPSEALPKEYVTVLDKRYHNGNNTVKAIYDKYIPAGGAVSDIRSKSAYHSPRLHKVFMDVYIDCENPRGAGTTWFHEHGHYIDYENGNISRSESFRKALLYDVSSFEKNYKKLHKLLTVSQARDKIADELASNIHKSHSIQDIFGGAHKKRYRYDLYGHPSSYWKNHGDWGVTTEAFAHMFEASFNEEKEKLMRKYFPTAWEEFKKLLGGLL